MTESETYPNPPDLSVRREAPLQSPGDSGRRLADHLPALLKQADVETVELDVLRRRPSFQGGEVSPQAQMLTDPARKEHRRRGFGFWEFVLSQSMTVDSATRRGLLQGAIRHNSDGAIRMKLPRGEFASRLTSGEYEHLSPRELVSFSSRVEVCGDRRRLHLPLLDLGVVPSETGQAAAVDAIECLGLRGLLFESGRSYHFYGTDPVPLVELTAILARAQLLAPIIDSRWVSHQLIDGRCGLRVSTDTEKSPHSPQLVARIGVT